MGLLSSKTRHLPWRNTKNVSRHLLTPRPCCWPNSCFWTWCLLCKLPWWYIHHVDVKRGSESWTFCAETCSMFLILFGKIEPWELFRIEPWKSFAFFSSKFLLHMFTTSRTRDAVHLPAGHDPLPERLDAVEPFVRTLFEELHLRCQQEKEQYETRQNSYILILIPSNSIGI